LSKLHRPSKPRSSEERFAMDLTKDDGPDATKRRTAVSPEVMRLDHLHVQPDLIRVTKVPEAMARAHLEELAKSDGFIGLLMSIVRAGGAVQCLSPIEAELKQLKRENSRLQAAQESAQAQMGRLEDQKGDMDARAIEQGAEIARLEQTVHNQLKKLERIQKTSLETAELLLKVRELNYASR
jgi:predicted nuclease with TOPRIM domain